MFAQRDRLPRALFLEALKTGRRFQSPHFLIVVPQNTCGYAVVIPKKVMKLSSSRHRIKRQVLEALRALPTPPALIVFPRFTTHSVNYEDITKELKELLSKVQK